MGVFSSTPFETVSGHTYFSSASLLCFAFLNFTVEPQSDRVHFTTLYNVAVLRNLSGPG